jgi:hypothetical protein
MAYQSNIPQPTDQLDISQGDLLGNFTAVNTYVNVNHVPFGSSDQGKHAFVTFPIQTVVPSFNAGEEGLYNKQLSSVSELYVNKQFNGSAVQIPMTASILSTSAPVSGGPGWTYLPSGIYLTWGTMTVNGNTTITLASPPPTQILSVMLTPITGSSSYVDAQVVVNAIISRTQFSVVGTINGAATNVTVGYLVLGY